MSTSPKSSLIERLVQDRLRSGDLEASAVQLLHLGEAASGDPTAHAASEAPGAGANGEPDPHDPTAHGLPANGLPVNGMASAASLSEAAGSIVAELPAGPFATDAFSVRPFPGDTYADPPVPAALEVRPLAEPAPPPTPATPFPLPGHAPSALVPPPATALPVSAQTSIPAPRDPVPPTAAPPPPLAPAQVVSQLSAQMEVERPDLVQGPPTIDAVALERGGMVDWSRTRSRISEEFRLIQRQILRAAFGPGAEPGFSNLLMVTSARPGEGKSFTSVNLAGSIARQGDHHVLLVDADSKRDSFCYALGLAEMRGLLDLVANPKLDPSPLIVKTPIDRLSILPVGRERERSAELFSTKEMTRLIQSLGRRYADRLLVLDAPPCLSTSDPAVLAPVVGQILFVVEADRTQRDEVEASLDLIQACPNITLVLNKQQISSRYTFGAYSSYYSS